MKIQFTAEASPLKTQSRIKSEVTKLLNNGRSQHYPAEWTEVDVTEGSEKCGYGPLHISGSVQHWNGNTRITYALENLGSQWRNYGAPHGTKHDVAIELKQVI